ncbi:unnamed protein product [Calicophoron daubneyi]|uniref:DNA-directed RNA polymerase RpoA/D/Rpb3-type domain-containing protein n=1 Tax=Calicophoron daubneyi TaxID=300641 RepID=A0AAV2TH08_CALDB
MYELKEHGIITHPVPEELWDLEKFRQQFRCTVISQSEFLEFDMMNLDCSFANAIRRILICEVPSVCIDRVYLQQNTSLMPDEVLCHRLGLIPLTVDPNLLTFPTKSLPETDDISGFNPAEHVIFDLHVEFKKAESKPQNRVAKEGANEEGIASVKSLSIYSSDLKWVPLPGQKETIAGDDGPPSAASQTILLNKLAVGDEVEARCLAVKGIGRDHAKFSPVCAAHYKFMPIITLLRPVEGDLAKKLQRSFAPGVIGIDEESQAAFVLNSRLDNGSREHMRHPEFGSDVIDVRIDPSHCIFTVESVDPVHRPPLGLVRSAIDVMISKCEHYLAVTETPGFGQTTDVTAHVKSQTSTSGAGTDETIKDSVAPGGNRSQVNGHEVGLEVTHMSPDRKRVTYTFYGEDHTLGSALRFCILRSTRASFCGYCIPHPLEDKIHFDIQVHDGSASDVLRDGLRCLRDCFTHIRSVFKKAVSEFKKTCTEKA